MSTDTGTEDALQAAEAAVREKKVIYEAAWTRYNSAYNEFTTTNSSRWTAAIRAFDEYNDAIKAYRKAQAAAKLKEGAKR